MKHKKRNKNGSQVKIAHLHEATTDIRLIQNTHLLSKLRARTVTTVASHQQQYHFEEENFFFLY